MTHGTSSRNPQPDMLNSPANADPGLFGQMFPSLKSLELGDDAALKLGSAMLDAMPVDPPNVDPNDNPDIPAGFTYLGQFIDHDITLDLTSIGEKREDKAGTTNFRTPALDLDSVYGLGPAQSPYLYERDAHTLAVSPKLAVGTASESPKIVDRTQIKDLVGFDLPRNPVTGTAIIGDPRNDENLLVAQIHVAFLRFHNAVVEHLKAKGVVEGLFEKAREKTVWHYQWLVLHEFLGKITGDPKIAEKILARGRRFYRFKKFPFIPVEFSVAAYRFGHSLVREHYEHNIVFRTGGATVATLDLLFNFTAKSGQIIGDMTPPPPARPLPFSKVLPSNWVVDWRRFFDFGVAEGTPNFAFNHARKLDPLVTPKLHDLPGATAESGPIRLPVLNLRRGNRMKLPSGQDVAREMDLPVLSEDQIALGPDGAVAKELGLLKQTPLWYYILKEAERMADGKHLGPVGAAIVAETFVGIVQGSPGSYLQAPTPFKPDPELGSNGDFTMVDLLKFAGFVNPIGE